MKNMKIRIKPFQVFADPDDQESIYAAIVEHLEEVSEENFFAATLVEEDDESYEEEDGV